MTNRTAALARLLEDWEAGRMTPYSAISGRIRERLFNEGLIHLRGLINGMALTETGLAVARAARREGE